MKCFIDDYNIVRIETNKFLETVFLNDEQLSFYEKHDNFQYFKSKERIPLHLANKIIVNKKEYPLYVGLVTLKEDFEKTYRYDGSLGAIYSKESTTFKVFSPVAKNITLVLEGKNYPMSYNNPIWEVTVKGDLDHKKYYYLVDLNETKTKATDPYALGGNQDYSVVIDLEKTYKMKNNFIKNVDYLDSVIYEGHIRDLTTFLDVPSKKLYLGLTEESKKLNMSVIEYIKDLGMTHLQLLPVQDFIEVDEINKDKYYNWGYNPQSYFTLTGWFSKNPKNYYERINELKQVIDYAHSKNLGVNIDVVYNHVYKRGMYPYDKFVPGYFFRHDKNFNATDGSLVGNEVETRNYMVRKLMVDSLIYLTKEFKVDGYRFDLMGLHDIDTMLLIEEKLKEINPNIMLYGEGWNMGEVVPNENRSNLQNNHLFPYYGHFNDFYRDLLKGHQYNLKRGYLAGNNEKLNDVLLALKGSSNIFLNAHSTVNYIDCHDNSTYHDHLIMLGIKKEELNYYLDFANHVVAISQGITFYHAGQELYRTKKLEGNSYNLSDAINGIEWKIPDSLNKFKKILKIKKEYLNKKDEIVSTRIFGNLILMRVKNEITDLNIYLKNDFSNDTIDELGKLIFNSQNVLIDKNNYKIDKPGVYIFEKVK